MGSCGFWLKKLAECRPHTIIEVATDVKLRVAYALADGDLVEVEVEQEYLGTIRRGGRVF
jgi:hypothetical protein